MGWIYDVGYSPAYDHEGWPASVLTDGTDTSTVSVDLSPQVTGWRSACDCGWRGATFYPRSEWPSEHGLAPEEVDGWESDTSCYAEWTAHVEEAVPELELYELFQNIEAARSQIDPTVRKARAAGASWTTIGLVTGMTRQSAHERWAGLETTPSS